MTNEEAIARIRDHKIIHKMDEPRAIYISEALDMAIKALEQEPCEGAISRQSAIFLANDLKEDLPDDEHIANMVLAHNEGILEYQTKLSLLPSVTPQQKIGRWITNYHGFPPEPTTVCSECGFYRDLYICIRGIDKIKYCSNCGAKMQEVEE